MKTLYLTQDKYSSYLANLIKEKQNFEIQSTAYTKKIRTEEFDIIFNDEGINDSRLLRLIEKVRDDANMYQEMYHYQFNNEYNFFDISERPPKTVVTKIDITSAYWDAALKNGIISESTNKYLLDNYPITKQMKMARLKALGSLATRKKIIQYIDGVRIAESERIITQPTKDLYMCICGIIAELMQECISSIDGAFYYYWDCVFTNKDSSEDVIEYIMKHNYSYKTQETNIEVVEIGRQTYLHCKSENKMYIVHPDKKHIIYT